MKLFKRKKQDEQTPSAGGLGRQRPVLRDGSMNRGQVFSYHGNRSQADLNVGRETSRGAAESAIPRRLPSRLQKLKAHAGWLIGFVLILTAVVYQMQLSSAVRVVSLVPANEAPYLQDSKVYSAVATELVRSSAANRNKLTVRTSAIADGLRQRFPELENATVALPLWGDVMTVYVKPAEPALLLTTPEDTFIVDKRGRALQAVAQDSRASKIPTVTDESNLQFKAGRQVLSGSVTAFIAGVAGQYRAQKTELQAMILPAGTSELHVYPAGKPFFVKFNLHDATEDSARMQAGSYAAVSNYLTAKNITPTQYIDVRLQGRVYFK